MPSQILSVRDRLGRRYRISLLALLEENLELGWSLVLVTVRDRSRKLLVVITQFHTDMADEVRLVLENDYVLLAGFHLFTELLLDIIVVDLLDFFDPLVFGQVRPRRFSLTDQSDQLNPPPVDCELGLLIFVGFLNNYLGRISLAGVQTLLLGLPLGRCLSLLLRMFLRVPLLLSYFDLGWNGGNRDGVFIHVIVHQESGEIVGFFLVGLLASFGGISSFGGQTLEETFLYDGLTNRFRRFLRTRLLL